MSTFSLSSLFSSGSAGGMQPVRTIMVNRSDFDGATIILSELGSNQLQHTLYMATESPDSKPNLHMSRSPPQSIQPFNGQQQLQQQNIPIGSAILHSLTYKIDLTLQGQTFQLKRSMLSLTGTYTLSGPYIAEMKWKVDQLSDSRFELHDHSGQLLATYKPASRFSMSSRPRIFEIFVTLSDPLLDLVVLSGLALKQMQTKESSATAEVIGAVAGA